MVVIEIIAVISTLVCVYLTTKQNVWCWPVGIVGIIAFFILFMSEKLYFQSSLQGIFLIQSIVGWRRWVEIKYHSQLYFDKDKVTKTESKVWWFLLLNTIAIGIMFSIYLGYFTDDTSPILDGFSTAFSILATGYLITKNIDAWYMWMVVNILLFIACMNQGLYITAGMEVILFILSVKGLREWKKDLKTVSA